MAVTTSVQNIQIGPADPSWGRQEMICVETIADVASSLDATYFTFDSIDSSGAKKEWYLWIDTGSSIDPAPAGKTGITVVIAPNDSAIVIAGLIETAVNLETEIHAKDRGLGVVLIQSKKQGAIDNLPVDVDSGFTISRQAEGFLLPLGFTEDIELSMSELLVEVTASQLGGEKVTDLRNGNEVGPISIVMKESDAAKLNELLKAGGSQATVDGDVVTGWGRARNFTNVIGDAGMLVLHPTGNADRTEDFVLFKAYPNVSGITFSGSDTRTVTVEFSIYQDELIRDEFSKYVVGDSEHNYLK